MGLTSLILDFRRIKIFQLLRCGRIHAPTADLPGFNIMHGFPGASSIRKLWMFRFQPREALLCVPDPGGLRREQEVHLLERALVRLRVESPDHGDRDDVADAEDVERLLADGAEHDWAEEGLYICQSPRR